MPLASTIGAGRGHGHVSQGQQLGLKVLGRIASYASAGLDPAYMGMGPVPASRRALERAGWKASDLDLLEINEAFAAQACAVHQEMGWDTSKVNVNGGPSPLATRLAHLDAASWYPCCEMAPSRGQEGHRIALYRWWHGRGPDHRALNFINKVVSRLASPRSFHKTKSKVAYVTGGMGGIGTSICQRPAQGWLHRHCRLRPEAVTTKSGWTNKRLSVTPSTPCGQRCRVGFHR